MDLESTPIERSGGSGPRDGTRDAGSAPGVAVAATLPRHDEARDAQGSPRAHWSAMMSRLAAADGRKLLQQRHDTRRMMREHGASYNVLADADGTDRSWELDLVPLILDAAEWKLIEEAVQQRASILDRVLADLYGPQRLLREGLLPPALLHGNAAYLYPLRDAVRASKEPFLSLYAVDLARAPDGKWWVLGDRTQAPAGAGYAFENRVAISRAFPGLFSSLKVRRLAPYFVTLRDSLIRLAPDVPLNAGASSMAGDHREGPAPLIVLLSPGPYHDAYAEQAFLARYLGFPLVVGSDLTVRHGFVWLKTLKGLQRVHVILRRIDDNASDPLECTSESLYGVAGLVEVVRRGHVRIANALGSGLLESGSLLGYLPRIARHLLGEELKMPSVATWWCGEAPALAAVIERIPELVFRDVSGLGGRDREAPVFGGDLDEKARAQFAQRLRAHPHHFVAQQIVRASQAPRIDADGRIGAAPVAIRVFAVREGNAAHRYVVMPGALTRVAQGANERILLSQGSGASKDTWVLADARSPDGAAAAGPAGEPEPGSAHAAMSFAHRPQRPVRGDDRLPSRTVENLFWFGRYAERCDNMARLLRRALLLELDGAAVPPVRDGWRAVVGIARWYGLLEDDVAPEDPGIHARLIQAVGSTRGAGFAANLQRLYDIAVRLHERLSVDNWRTLNQTVIRLARHDEAVPVDAALKVLDEAAAAMMTLTGFALEGMTRDVGWRFLQIGRRIERVQNIGIILREALDLDRDASLDWALELADSIATYRARYLARPTWLPLLDLLVLDESNPRSIIFQLNALQISLERLASLDQGRSRERLGDLPDSFRRLDPEHDLRPGPGPLRDRLDALLVDSSTLSNELCRRFFSLSGLRGEGFAAPGEVESGARS